MSKQKDLTGQKFNYLTALYYDKNKGTGKWYCKCECGKFKFIQTNHLVSGDISSCGCLKGVWKLLDLKGKIFGMLTVLSAIPYKKPTEWLCQCECGNTTNARTSNLTNGHTQSCGCLRSITTTREKMVDFTGRKVGSVHVIDRIIDREHITWNTICDCGNKVELTSTMLHNNKYVSCGCALYKMRSELSSTHGLSKHRIYRIWNGMKARCNNKNNNKYKHWGGRGISICDEWNNDFIDFYIWSMNNNYQEHLTIDRINNDGNYEPSNCRWATWMQQMNNTSRNVKPEIVLEVRQMIKNGISHRKIAEMLLVNRSTISKIRNNLLYTHIV